MESVDKYLCEHSLPAWEKCQRCHREFIEYFNSLSFEEAYNEFEMMCFINDICNVDEQGFGLFWNTHIDMVRGPPGGPFIIDPNNKDEWISLDLLKSIIIIG